MSEQQREFFLREQLKVIQKELGISKDDRTAEVETFRERIAKLDAARAGAKAHRRGDAQALGAGDRLAGIRRHPQLSRLGDRAAVGRAVPATSSTSTHARKMLDRDHDGLEDVKDRIIEFLAVGAMQGRDRPARSCCWSARPASARPRIGRSVADALGRKFYRFSLGGMRDEAEIKGHRRTYIGAHAGQVHAGAEGSQVANPVIMLDEIDKIGASLPGRSGLGAAGSARSGAEHRIPRSLSRRALRPVQGAVHLHRQPARHHSRAAARPHGNHPAVRLHHRGKTRHRQNITCGRKHARARRPEEATSSTSAKARSGT